ncbi:uncharacterized protein [Epargyreus clarus]|uniref:uncharacterized protein n=1 Tax=Epargyreus clarus TaxID=520877 RepID=UPI003C2BF7FA
MGDICRLCCSTKFVNHYIFDEENNLYLKMSLYLPITVIKNDRLPQKICDRCCYKINDFYQFYNKTIEVQHRLRLVYATVLPLDDSIDLTVVKQNALSPPPPPIHNLYNDQSTQTDSSSEHIKDQYTNSNIKQIKLEPLSIPASPVKSEGFDMGYANDLHSDDSEDTLLINLKKPKKCKKDREESKNGEIRENKRGRKSKSKVKDWNMLPHKLLKDNLLKESGELSRVEMSIGNVKEEVLEGVPMGDVLLEELHKVKQEVDGEEHFCCICFASCNNKQEMLQHYKAHGRKAEGKKPAGAFSAPPEPDTRPLRCQRCQKTLQSGEWAAHWRRHWDLDRRPYRCALCERTFRNHYQIHKHGLTHKSNEMGMKYTTPAKRFICDLCPEEFVYMRCLLAHRTRAHPEAAARALALRCAVCARQFAHLNSLRRHQRAHSGERNFLCCVCGKALSSREHLTFHLRIHTGYKPHACKTCGKAFVKKCNLTLHERVHSGEKPHVCAHCGKAFSQRSTLVIHERYHSGARPYVCALCGRGFVAKGLLSMHLKTTCVDAGKS